MLTDSMTAALAVAKGRSNAALMVPALKQIGALLLATGCGLRLRWLPSELNPAMPTVDEITPDDSNNGIENSWVKICVNVFKQDRGL